MSRICTIFAILALSIFSINASKLHRSTCVAGAVPNGSCSCLSLTVPNCLCNSGYSGVPNYSNGVIIGWQSCDSADSTDDSNDVTDNLVNEVVDDVDLSDENTSWNYGINLGLKYQDEGLTPGGIVGIVLGVLMVLGLIYLLFQCYRESRNE